MNQAAPADGAAWSFNAACLPLGERASAWAGAMRRLHLPFAEPARDAGAEGTVTAVTTPMGFEYALVSGGPQIIAGRTPGAIPGLWLGLLIEGCGRLEVGQETVDLSPGMLIYGATGVDAALRFGGPFRQLFVRIPKVAIDTRLLAPVDERVSILEPETLSSHALLALLHSLAGSLDAKHAGDHGPVESALIELLVPALAQSGGPAAQGGMAGQRARQFERVCRAIETRLGDPDLSVRSVAAGEGVSVRYLQQLFSKFGQTVIGYIKARRLERARAELQSPLHAQLSISEICYRWGFSQSAHFSRAYRERYGEAPRDTRNRARATGEVH
ncbi:AraC-like DNA-binding protein [Altererythrobacter atlanticus]|uniref:Transcriptional activator NphR n=1 Tax=Croceibacterium atlanticum TaxID=1267766 RepID=A0A0F7KKK7_9SPHN|nr:helix-turn-helix domain-containing protein [Croceibacterium atlanticum]AKH41123.1 Transcriptional activator NphR [Croceibacterium atlanticum]MBB5732639.1 AraC-like DNA-binding protein [Croceibacterium atlanticum]